MIAAIGTRGDVQPYIALATGLQRAGQRSRWPATRFMRSAELDSYHPSRGAA
jgi:UDP:flavonoid glycosyltransferase YjiC (YdhE family)